MPSYALPSDLAKYGTNANALKSVALSDQLAAIEDASRVADGYLRSRYPMPLQTWEADLTSAVCRIAVLELIRVKGFRPGAGTDQMYVYASEKAFEWLKDVSRQQLHPNIVPAPSAGETPMQPRVITKSPRGF